MLSVVYLEIVGTYAKAVAHFLCGHDYSPRRVELLSIRRIICLPFVRYRCFPLTYTFLPANLIRARMEGCGSRAKCVGYTHINVLIGHTMLVPVDGLVEGGIVCSQKSRDFWLCSRPGLLRFIVLSASKNSPPGTSQFTSIWTILPFGA
jgi:hypothetical protein